MNMPTPGTRIGRFTVEECEVGHVGIGGGRYEYPVEMVLSGKGGKQGVRNDLKELFGARRSTFSGYGNPYQLAFDRSEVESLGEGRYKVVARGVGNRIFLRKELSRFLEYLGTEHDLESPSEETMAAILDDYLAAYQADAKRKKPRLPY